MPTPSSPCSKSAFAAAHAAACSLRISVAAFCAAAISPSSFDSVAISSFNFAIFEVALSIFVDRSSSSVSLSSFFAFVSDISLSQKALCAASFAASASSFSVLPEHGGGLNALRQKGELLVVVLLRKALEKVNNVLLHLLRLRSGLGHRADLDEGVGPVGGSAGLLLENLLRSGERLELLSTCRLRLRVLLRGGHALLLKVLKMRLVVREVLGRRLELALRNGLRLLGRSLGLLRLRQRLLAERDGILELLLQHLEVERAVHLGLLRRGKLGLRLLEHVLKNAQDATRLRLVRGRVRRTARLQLEVRIARTLRRLEERLHLRLIGGVHASRHNHGLQRIHDLVHRPLALDEPGLRHLALDDAVSALEHRYGFHQLLLANLRRAREVRGGGGDGRAELLDLRLRGANLRRLVGDGSLGPLDIRLTSLDLELQIHRVVVAVLREILEELVLFLTLLGDLRDETIEELHRLLDGGDGTNHKEQCKCALHFAPLTKAVPSVKGP